MMSVEVKVNGVLISYIYIHNEGLMNEVTSVADDRCKYLVECYEPCKEIIKTEGIIHRRSDSYEILLSRIFSWINKQRSIRKG